MKYKHRDVITGRFKKRISLVERMAAYQLTYEIIYNKLEVEIRKNLEKQFIN